MSEEKLYAVKTDEGKYWELSSVFSSTTNSKEQAKLVAKEHGGHVVTLIEEPEKVVITKEQARIVEKARVSGFPGSYVYSHLLINALVNGYTVAKEKKYNVKVPHVSLYYWKNPDGGLGIDDLNVATADNDTDDFEFTESEIEYYGLQDCEKEEVTDDE